MEAGLTFPLLFLIRLFFFRGDRVFVEELDPNTMRNDVLVTLVLILLVFVASYTILQYLVLIIMERTDVKNIWIEAGTALILTIFLFPITYALSSWTTTLNKFLVTIPLALILLIFVLNTVKEIIKRGSAQPETL